VRSSDMADQEEVQKVVNALAEHVGCPQCDTRLRFGDLECPHCGVDLDDHLRSFAETLLDALHE